MLSQWRTLLSFPNSHCSLNPVVKLFTGHCRTEGLLEGQKFVNESDFGAFPIQVQGHAHLHDSLEAACVNSEMGQEVRGESGKRRKWEKETIIHVILLDGNIVIYMNNHVYRNTFQI